MMKFKKLMTGAAIGSALLLVGCGQSEEVASTTAGRIRQDEFYERLKTAPSPQGGTYGEIVLQQMLLEDILEETYGDEVSEEDIDEEIARLAEPQGGREALEEAMAETGEDISQLEDSVKMNLMLTAAVADQAEYSEEDVKNYHDAQIPDGTRVAHILVEDEDEANDLIDELNDGADFAELAEEHSTDPGSASNGGEYELESGQMIPEFEEAAMELEEGEITEEPVESQFGYHIITMLEKGEKEDFEDVKDEVTREYVQEELLSDPQAVSSTLTTLVEDANVNISDEDLQNAMVQFMAEPEEATGEDPSQAIEQAPEEGSEESESTEDESENEENSEESDSEEGESSDSDSDNSDSEDDNSAENEE